MKPRTKRTNRATPPLRQPLSAREVEICTALAAGRTDSETGFALKLSVASVRTYLQRACRKLGVSRRLDVALKFKCLTCPHFRGHDSKSGWRRLRA